MKTFLAALAFTAFATAALADCPDPNGGSNTWPVGTVASKAWKFVNSSGTVYEDATALGSKTCTAVPGHPDSWQ